MHAGPMTNPETIINLWTSLIKSEQGTDPVGAKSVLPRHDVMMPAFGCAEGIEREH